MRYDTHAGCSRRGVPIFVTWSPAEKHNVLMLRLSRSRASDPVNEFDVLSQKYGALDQPSVDCDYVGLGFSLEDMMDWLPDYDDRRTLLARDGLGSVEGFRLSILLVYEHLFGMRVCFRCPDCNNRERTKSRVAKHFLPWCCARRPPRCRSTQP